MAQPLPTTEASEGAPAPVDASATPRARLLADRAARVVVSAGGLAVIAAVAAILAFLVIEVIPLFRPAHVGILASRPGSHAPVALLLDRYGTHAAAVDAGGRLRIERADGTPVLERELATELATPGGPARVTSVAVHPGGSLFAIGAGDGRALLAPIEWRTRFVENHREVEPALGEPTPVRLDPEGRPLLRLAVAGGSDTTTLAALLPGGVVALAEVTRRRNALTGETSVEQRTRTLAAPIALGSFALDAEGRRLYAAGPSGELLLFPLDPPDSPPVVHATGGAPITALAPLIGGRSLVTGDAHGNLRVWFPPGQAGGNRNFVAVRALAGPGAPIVALAVSQRDRSVLAARADGVVSLHFSTSGRTLFELDAGVGVPGALGFAPRGDAALVSGAEGSAVLAIHNPHPEVGLRALAGRVWYEGYPRPEFVWQSTGGTDDFEPKLSLVPLVVGTLKGTFYSLLLALPLGILGAMYTSQFMHPRLQRIVKPTVELMASLPTVVLGLLAGLFLAPRLEASFPALLVLLVGLPLVTLLAGLGWSSLPARLRGRVPEGGEVLFYAVVLALAIWGAFALSPGLERALFDGSFPAWLERTTGLRYDQRNAIVIGIAMGFAVIPIVFSIAEDSFSAVPPSLAAGSLALGANRWQTVTRVVLPAASPGLFAAGMIGFGRAVGETMIVLMATGNTPLLDLSPFDGFRTLSANIAVEIPEAPQGGTLYRVLFLSALLLFGITFVINTLSELVRERLRARYGRS